MTPHCREPEMCSVCREVPARKVEIIDGVVHVNGQPTGRMSDPGLSPRQRQYAQRGARRRK